LLTLTADGTLEVGGRKINDTEAKVMLRTLEAKSARRPPRKIAWMLHQEGIPAPRHNGWGASTINGNSGRGLSILNNSLYVGKLVWNKLKYIRDPETGRRRRTAVSPAPAALSSATPSSPR
jgi:site-specific DNA recombinase